MDPKVVLEKIDMVKKDMKKIVEPRIVEKKFVEKKDKCIPIKPKIIEERIVENKDEENELTSTLVEDVLAVSLEEDEKTTNKGQLEKKIDSNSNIDWDDWYEREKIIEKKEIIKDFVKSKVLDPKCPKTDCDSENTKESNSKSKESTSFSVETICFCIEEFLKFENIKTYRKKHFSSEGLVLLHCRRCRKTREKIPYVTPSYCTECDKMYVFVCAKCYGEYLSHTALITHLKHYCHMLKRE